MTYIEKNLVPGEVVIYQTRLHWIVMFWHIVLSVLLLEIPALLLLFYAMNREQMDSQARHLMVGGGIALLLISGVIISVGAIKRNSTEMAVTSRRVLIKTGIASRRTIEMLLSKIESIVVTEPFWGRMFGYGTVVIRGTGGTPEPFYLVANPTEFRRHVQQQIETQQTETRPGAPLAN